MNLELNTTAFLIIIGNVLMGGGLLAVSRGALRRMQGVSAWAIATLMQGFGWFISVPLRGVIPTIISNPIGNGLIMLCLGLYLIILADFCGKTVRASLVYWAVAIQSVLLGYFSVVTPNTAARIVVISACAGGILLSICHVLLTGNSSTGSRRRPASQLFTAALFGMCGVATVVRGTYYTVGMVSSEPRLVVSPPIGDITLLTIYMMSVMATFGFLLMCEERDMTERNRAEAEVMQLNATLEERILRRTEQLENANRDMESFNYSISHDLRAPLRSILGFTQMLSDKEGATLSPEAVHQLARVEYNARRMDALIEDLLAFSRVSKGTLEQCARVDMKDLVESLLEDLGLENKVALGAIPPVDGDPSLLRQVWQNLILNAVKFSRGAEKPEVRISGSLLPDGSAQYVVEDNGVGFDMAYAGRLFGVFQRPAFRSRI
jgi:signal transduction histidine kinase